ncbi:hypothetical protein ABW21_db0209703 [Orbilia brochopaga]|nr:hypothetical protein ABW21_db0209703 [Drechslerella brochopaga]
MWGWTPATDSSACVCYYSRHPSATRLMSLPGRLVCPPSCPASLVDSLERCILFGRLWRSSERHTPSLSITRAGTSAKVPGLRSNVTRLRHSLAPDCCRYLTIDLRHPPLGIACLAVAPSFTFYPSRSVAGSLNHIP